MAKRKTASKPTDAEAVVELVAIAEFTCAAHEGNRKRGAHFETTPARARHLVEVLKVARPA